MMLWFRFTAVVRMVMLAGGIVLMAAAFLLPTSYRARSGLHGFRGQVQSDNLVFLICAVVVLITGLNATSTLSAIYIGIGVVVVVAYFLLLRLTDAGRTALTDHLTALHNLAKDASSHPNS